MEQKLRDVLITDRRQADVSRAAHLISLFDGAGIWRGTEQERVELAESCGVYSFVDVNRVLRACAWLAERIERHGYKMPFDYWKACLVTAKAEPPGGGTVRSALCYKGEEALVKAISGEGYRFRRWEERGETVSTASEYSFTADADRELTAVFGVITEEESSVVGLAVVGTAILGKDVV